MFQDFCEGDGLKLGPDINRSFVADTLAQGFCETKIGKILFGVEPFTVFERAFCGVQSVTAPLKGDALVRLHPGMMGKHDIAGLEINEMQRPTGFRLMFQECGT